MNVDLVEVSGSKVSLEGFDQYGRLYRIRGTMAFPEFKGTVVTTGPCDFVDMPCSALIDDTTATLTITPKLFRFTGSEVFS